MPDTNINQIDDNRKQIRYEVGVCTIDIFEGDSICDVYIDFGKHKCANKPVSTICETTPILRWAFDELPNVLDSVQFETVEYDNCYYKLLLKEQDNQTIVESSTLHINDPDGNLKEKIQKLKTFIMEIFSLCIKDLELKSMKNRSAIVALTVIFIGSGCYAQVLPGDGVVLTAYSVEAEVADAATGAVCDLSDVVIRGSEEMSFRYYGDSTVCRKSNMAVEWYEIKGDTVWSLGRNTRDQAMRYRNGAPYLRVYPTKNVNAGGGH